MRIKNSIIIVFIFFITFSIRAEAQVYIYKKFDGGMGAREYWDKTNTIPEKNCDNYSSNYENLKDERDQKTLKDYINENWLGSNVFICLKNEDLSGINSFKGNTPSYILDLKENTKCKDTYTPGGVAGAGRFSGSYIDLIFKTGLNYKLVCNRDGNGIGRIQYCQNFNNSTNKFEGCQTKQQITTSPEAACELSNYKNKKFLDIRQTIDSNGSCNNFLTCERSETNFSDEVSGSSKTRTMFCLPEISSDNKSVSGKIYICPNIINLNGSTAVVNYELAKNIKSGSISGSQGTCKNFIEYEQNPILLEDLQNVQFCSLSTNFNTENAKLGNSCQNPSTCESGEVISRGATHSIYCIDPTNSNQTTGSRYVCANSYMRNNMTASASREEINSYASAREAIGLSADPNGGYSGDTKPCVLFEDFRLEVNLNRSVRSVEALGYTGILQRVSQLLYAVAIFLFVFLMIINGIHLVRSGNSPEELKKAKEGIFKTIAGFLFVLFSGGFIISIINSMQQ